MFPRFSHSVNSVEVEGGASDRALYLLACSGGVSLHVSWRYQSGPLLDGIPLIQTVACAALELREEEEREDLEKVGQEILDVSNLTLHDLLAGEQKPGNILTDLFLQVYKY